MITSNNKMFEEIHCLELVVWRDKSDQWIVSKITKEKHTVINYRQRGTITTDTNKVQKFKSVYPMNLCSRF